MAALTPKVDIPRYNKVRLLIFQYSSLLKLHGGVKFRVCNVCSRRLPSELSDQHSKHLKMHEKHWNIYLIMISKLLQQEILIKAMVKMKKLLQAQILKTSLMFSMQWTDYNIPGLGLPL